MSAARAWGHQREPSLLDLLDLANAAVRRLEAVVHLIGEAERAA